MKPVLLFSLFWMLISFPLAGQEIQCYLIGVDQEKIYLDRSTVRFNEGEVYQVYIQDGHFIHPVTRKKIPKEKEFITTVEIVHTAEEYTTVVVNLSEASNRLQTGIYFICNHLLYPCQPFRKIIRKKTVTIAPAKVNDIVGVGYFGEYVADMLMEEIITSPHIRIIDRSILGYQMEEADLTGSYINANAPAIKGNISGIQYRIEVTMQKPDVTNVSTGIPLAFAMGALQNISGTNLGAQYMSNVQVSRLRSSVHISARVVDMQTGEVMFICSGEGNATGQTQVGLEQGALSGARINEGVEGFKQTVTGKATQMAFRRIGRYLRDYFAGDMEQKVAGRAGLGYDNQPMTLKGYKLYLGTEKIDKYSAQMYFEHEPELYFSYRKGKKFNRIGNLLLYCSLPAGGIAIGLASATSEEIDMEGIAAAGLVTFGIIAAGGIILKIYSRKELKNTIQGYNRTQSRDLSSGLYLQPADTFPGLSLSYRF